MGKSYKKIAGYVKSLKLRITRILQKMSKDPNKPYCKTKSIWQYIKLNVGSQKVLICHIKWFLYNNLVVLSIFFKSSHTLFQKTVRFYLKTTGYLQFKAYRKSFLT